MLTKRSVATITIESCLKVRGAKTGEKTFSAVRKLTGKAVRVRIGAYPEIGLREARMRAGEFRELRTLAPTAAARAEEVADSVSASAANFFADYVADMKARSVKSYGRIKGTLMDGKYALLPFLVERHGGMQRAGDVTIHDLQAWMAESCARSPNYAPQTSGSGRFGRYQTVPNATVTAQPPVVLKNDFI